MTERGQIISCGDNEAVILTSEMLKAAGLVTGATVDVTTEKREGQAVIVLTPIKPETLTKKYAHYEGTPASYQQPDDLKGWQSTQPVGKELL